MAETLDSSANLGAPATGLRTRQAGAPPVYERRRPELSNLHQVVRENLNTLYAAVEDGWTSTRLPEFVRREFEQYLECGLLYAGRGVMRAGARDRYQAAA